MNSYILAFLLLFTVLSSSLLPDRHPDPKKEKAETGKVVFKSTDGGQTWQDISKGLPENLLEGGIQRNGFFANDKGLYLKVGNGFYHNAPNATAPFWAKEIFPYEYSSIAAGKSGRVVGKYWGINLKKADGTSIWSPVFELFAEPRIRSTFETAGGAIFIGTDKGFFKTANNGKTWKHVHTGSLVGHLAEANGVLLAISTGGIIRSTDNGENWAVVSTEGDVAWDVKQIKGGFAAITSDPASNTRRLRTSHDGGKTWQLISADLRDNVVDDSIWRTWNDRPNVKASAVSIIPVGENFICVHRDGIFRSSDKGKTWELLLPAVGDKVFNLLFSGNVIYAIPGKGGC